MIVRVVVYIVKDSHSCCEGMIVVEQTEMLTSRFGRCFSKSAISYSGASSQSKTRCLSWLHCPSLTSVGFTLKPSILNFWIPVGKADRSNRGIWADLGLWFDKQRPDNREHADRDCKLKLTWLLALKHDKPGSILHTPGTALELGTEISALSMLAKYSKKASLQALQTVCKVRAICASALWAFCMIKACRCLGRSSQAIVFVSDFLQQNALSAEFLRSACQLTIVWGSGTSRRVPLRLWHQPHPART